MVYAITDINVAVCMITHCGTDGEMTLTDLCVQFSENPKSADSSRVLLFWKKAYVPNGWIVDCINLI